MPEESVAIVLGSDGIQQSSRWRTTPLIRLGFLYRQNSQFASLHLSCMSPPEPGENRRKRRGSLEGVLSKSKKVKRVVPLCSLLDKRQILSQRGGEAYCWLIHFFYIYIWVLPCSSICIICEEGGSLTTTFIMILSLPVWARRDARLLLAIR